MQDAENAAGNGIMMSRHDGEVQAQPGESPVRAHLVEGKVKPIQLADVGEVAADQVRQLLPLLFSSVPAA